MATIQNPEVAEDRDGGWRFRVFDGSGDTLATSEPYATAQAAVAGLAATRQQLAEPVPAAAVLGIALDDLATGWEQGGRHRQQAARRLRAIMRTHAAAVVPAR